MSLKTEIHSNIVRHMDRFLIPDKETYHGLFISDIHRQNSYSSRLCGKCTLEYSTSEGDVNKRIFWVKRVNQPQIFFNELSTVWTKLEKAGLNQPITRPYWYDNRLGVVYIGNTEGISLLKKTLAQVLLGPLGSEGGLVQIYRKLGVWLSRFHTSLKSNQTIGLDEIIDRLQTALTRSSWLALKEKNQLKLKLDFVQDTERMSLELVRTHNDFSLRNILVSGSRFGIIDWDAMVHPHMPDLAPAWYEISFFLINLQSLLRFHPLASKKVIASLKTEFLKGYFLGKPNKENELESLLYVFTLRHFLGMDSDRALPQIYRTNLGSRFVKMLRKALLSGHPGLV